MSTDVADRGCGHAEVTESKKVVKAQALLPQKRTGREVMRRKSGT